MRLKLILIVVFFFSTFIPAFCDPQTGASLKTIHVFVALCDNDSQGIVPVPDHLGNGDDYKNNLYWGAMYGVKTFFRKSPDWRLIDNPESGNEAILERCVFKHRQENVYLVADAYQGREIKRAIRDMLVSSAGRQNSEITVSDGERKVCFSIGGGSALLAYIGHDGLMEFSIDDVPSNIDERKREVIVLACSSKRYFAEPLKKTGAEPLLWTTGLMAPEAYTLESAIDGWIENESNEDIRLRAAKAYSKYQKCRVKSAQRLFVNGW